MMSNRKKTLAIQPVAALPRIPDGQAQLQLHSVGYADLQPVRFGRSPATCSRMVTPNHSKELMETTEWDGYGTQSGNPQCANCMVHCGYEPTSVDDTFGSLRGFVDTVKATFSLYPERGIRRSRSRGASGVLVQIRWCRLTLRPQRA